jgi:RimJ/RimL family protein N-acetyltransferase
MLFETEQWVVREFEAFDIDPFMEYRNNEEWMKFQYFKGLSKAEYEAKLLTSPIIEEGIQYAVISKQHQRLIGDLFLIRKKQWLTIGFTIHPDFSGKGYMSDIVTHYVTTLKTLYPECQILAMTHRENKASQGLLKRVGFLYEEWIEEYESELFVYPQGNK